MNDSEFLDVISIALNGKNASVGKNEFSFDVNWLLDPDASFPKKIMPYIVTVLANVKSLLESCGCMDELNKMVYDECRTNKHASPIMILSVKFSTKPYIVDNNLSMAVEVTHHSVLENYSRFSSCRDEFFSECGRIVGEGLVVSDTIKDVQSFHTVWVYFVENEGEKPKCGILKESNDEECVVVYNPENPYGQFDIGSVSKIETITVQKTNIVNKN